MLSRIFWVGIAGVALVIGILLQDGGRIFSMAAESESVDGVQRSIEASVDRAIDGSFDGMQVMDGDGNEIDVPPETKRALGEAVGRLVKAKADLAILKMRDANAAEIAAVEARSAQARADVDRLKAEIKGEEAAARAEHDALAAQIERDVRQSVRDDIRAEIRDAVRN
jgi:hypothetical protein